MHMSEAQEELIKCSGLGYVIEMGGVQRGWVREGAWPPPSQQGGMEPGSAVSFPIAFVFKKAIRNLITFMKSRLESLMKRMQLCDQCAIFQSVDRNVPKLASL